MSSKRNAVAVTILGKEYRIGCEPEDEEALLKAARFLDASMKEIRGTGKVIGTDRIAVMAALNIAHELLAREHNADTAASTANKRIRALRERIEVALNDSAQLEL
ncbi:cell division protein ZapA [endosymbiont of unidentified scaly snail isolate Monju]|uniref:cell division protein ZapA n=1 Tax=endosymbiont of unidentified scaly snail isolate Monju TaxID=1248727 RepID=UPI000389213C|nr:cell division protein ZapA [endosymbiont of unidentified scaly snail isolate Monju]BAN70179.1 cell division protein ZapA [endosymbiont of unidentified scaly snail isolate Monju]